MITLTKLKAAGGDETARFEASLCLDGKMVAVVSNGGAGGACHVSWTITSRKDTRAFQVFREASREALRLEPDLFPGLDAEAPYADFPWNKAEAALDFWLLREVEIMGHARVLDRACKTYTVVRLRGAKSGEFWKVKGADEATLTGQRAKLDVAVVLNDLPSRERAERIMRGEA